MRPLLIMASKAFESHGHFYKKKKKVIAAKRRAHHKYQEAVYLSFSLTLQGSCQPDSASSLHIKYVHLTSSVLQFTTIDNLHQMPIVVVGFTWGFYPSLHTT